MAQSLQESGSSKSYQQSAPAISLLLNTHTPGPHPKETEQALKMHVLTHIFTQQRGMKQPKCPSKDGWISKLWYPHTAEHYSAIKRTNN